MRSILFIQSQTLYSKATIPVAIACANRGWDVTFQVNRPVIFGSSFGFSDNYIRNNPTSVSVVNPQSLQYVAGLIGLGSEWNLVKKRINFSLVSSFFPKRFDVVIGTIKNMDVLQKISNKDINTFALGYQHLPVLVKVDKDISTNTINLDVQSIFFSDNEFSNDHKFNNIVKNYKTIFTNFTYLDVVPNQKKEKLLHNQVLIFHPGGYRNIISSPGDNKTVCYRKQKKFLQELCIPLINKGLTPIIKIHPLRARYHDLDDMEKLSQIIERDNQFPDGSIQILGPKESFWDVAFDSSFIITFGSSAIYELWSVGIKNVYIFDFIGSERSRRFSYFESVFVKSSDEYHSIIDQSKGQSTPSFDDFTKKIFKGYSSLFGMNSVDLIIDEIERC
jgi:hypothetical protein